MPSQVRLSPLGLWHRRALGNGHTACGIDIAGAFASREGYGKGNGLDLCPECFTVSERDTGRMRKIERDAMRSAAADAFFDFDDEATTETTVIPNDHHEKKHG